MFEWPYFPGALSGALLFLAGWRAFDCWRELRTRERAAFWAISALGLFYLALDEWFEAHERLALWLFPNLGVVNPPDDVIIMSYGLAAIVIGLLCWKQITANATVFHWLAGAATATVLAGLIDGFGVSEHWVSAIAEEACEFSAGWMALTAMRTRLASARAATAEREAQAVPAAQIDASVTVSQRSNPL